MVDLFCVSLAEARFRSNVEEYEEDPVVVMKKWPNHEAHEGREGFGCPSW
jgi:hypothetical protein